jgi:ATP-dependent HslUV protease subunit HslV
MTTIVLVRKNNEVVVAGDGQVSMGNTVVKSTASKVRKIEKRDVVAGFAGSTADALTLFERLEAKNRKACWKFIKSSCGTRKRLANR